MTLSSTQAGAYAAKLRDPRWQKKRLDVLNRAGWSCEMCGDSESTLHVHHKQYLRGYEPWDYDTDQLASLCATCHKDGHGSPDVLLNVISRLAIDGPYGRDAVARLVSWFVGQKPLIDHGLQYWHLGNIATQMLFMSDDGLKSLVGFLGQSKSDIEIRLASAIGWLIAERSRVRQEAYDDR